MRSALLICWTAIATLAGPALASAAQRYAAPSGSGTVCSAAAPCALEHAVEAAVGGDEVIVTPGTYSQTAIIEATAAVHVHGQAGMPAPLITSTASTAIQIDDPGTRLSDLRLEHTGLYMALRLNGGTAERIVSRSSGSFGACDLGDATTMLDSICFSTASGASAVLLFAPGVSFAGTLRNVTAIATGAGSRGLLVESVASGVATLNATNVIASGAQLDILAGDDGDASSTTSVTLFRSNFATTDTYGTQTSITSPGGATNQTAEPVFANFGTGDFRQLPGSPTIDAGDSSVASALDFESALRPQGVAVDIGADEATDPAALLELVKEKLRPKRKLKISMSCPVAACEVAAEGRLKVPGKKRKVVEGDLSLAAGASGELKLKLSKRIAAALKEEPKKARLKLTAAAVDPLGFSGEETRRYKFKR